MIELTDKAIDIHGVLTRVRTVHAGAVVLFLGTTRCQTGGKATASLDYECYTEMAQEKLAELELGARALWPSLLEICITHRLGHVGLGEESVAIAVSSPHRSEAFEAGRWLIDRIKEGVPIWKKENWDDGTSQWVHPGTAPDVGDTDGC